MKQVYRLRVKFKYDKRTYRDILIRDDQTFEKLHDIIFVAFDREEEHLYRFYFKREIPALKELSVLARNLGVSVSGKNHYEMLRITSPDYMDDSIWEADGQMNAAKARLREVKLQVKQKFEYLFDFGDSWWHEIEVMEILPLDSSVTYPAIVKVKGESPPQYTYPDEEEDIF